MLSSYSPAATEAVKTLSETRVSGGGSSLERRGLRCERAVHTADLRNWFYFSLTLVVSYCSSS